MPSPKLRAKHQSRPPTLVQVYVDFAGTGDDVHAEYARRWLAWHAEQCGRTGCTAHVDPHNIVQKGNAR